MSCLLAVVVFVVCCLCDRVFCLFFFVDRFCFCVGCPISGVLFFGCSSLVRSLLPSAACIVLVVLSILFCLFFALPFRDFLILLMVSLLCSVVRLFFLFCSFLSFLLLSYFAVYFYSPSLWLNFVSWFCALLFSCLGSNLFGVAPPQNNRKS